MYKKVKTMVDGKRVLWKVGDNDYVVTSIASPITIWGTPRDETLVFQADEEGNITSFLDLKGSIFGECNHYTAIKNHCYHRFYKEEV